jgi:hypothetical protein
MERRLIYMGGNGHCAARLTPARDASARLAAKGAIPPLDLIDVPYPGFEDRPRALGFEAFLASVSGSIAAVVSTGDKTVLYGSGIGGLLALCLRARGEWPEVPLLLQAPVLWGLERRLMPRVMRLGPARLMLRRLFALGWFQRRFIRKQFERPLTPALREAFFDGYARCPAAADFFAWLTPALLRRMERQFAARPGALEGIGLWWGARDRVVTLDRAVMMPPFSHPSKALGFRLSLGWSGKRITNASLNAFELLGLL